MPPKLSTEEFIQKARCVHHTKYDYVKVQYTSSSTKIQIICPIHGEFSQRPTRHLSGDGCPKCANNVKLTYEEFVNKSRELHNNKYDYSKVDYQGHHSMITIICPIHGDFVQKANSHLRGCGCHKCIRTYPKDTTTFVIQANLIHGNKYDYSNVNYSNQSTPICIVCPIHGEFSQRPSDHVHSLAGCPRCVSNVSKLETSWLDELGITKRQVKIQYNGGYYIVDGYDENTNTIYEFYGDYWHGNPQKYPPNQQHPVNSHITYGHLYIKTIERQSKLKELGYNIVHMWESDYKNR